MKLHILVVLFPIAIHCQLICITSTRVLSRWGLHVAAGAASPRLTIGDSGERSVGSKFSQIGVTLSSWVLTIDQEDFDYFRDLNWFRKEVRHLGERGISITASQPSLLSSFKGRTFPLSPESAMTLTPK